MIVAKECVFVRDNANKHHGQEMGKLLNNKL